MLNKLIKKACAWKGVTLIVSSIILIEFVIRSMGWLQSIELSALDLYFQIRPLEPPDQRFLIVGIEEADIQKIRKYPISDGVLAELLTKIKEQQPAVIGLDIYRDIPVEPGYQELVKIFKNTPNLIGIQKTIGDTYTTKIAPPPILKQLKQSSANDIVVDGDGVIRRGILYPYAEEDPSLPSLGLSVAINYLKNQKVITPVAGKDGFLQLGKTLFLPFERNDGGYVNTDDGSYQILLNYRSPAEGFPHVSMSDVLARRIPPDLMRDRIVLIGAYAPSLNDRFYTPFSRRLGGTTPIRTPGVEIQANLASQIISSALDERPLIKVWHDSLEYFWMGCWVTLTAILIRKSRYKTTEFQFFITASISVVILALSLIAITYSVFLSGWWIPLVPSLIGIFTSSILVAGYNYIKELKIANSTLRQTINELNTTLSELQKIKIELSNKIAENEVLYSEIVNQNQNLEIKVEERTQELKLKNTQLSETIFALRNAQRQIIAQEKLAALGLLTAGVAHELKNPLNFVNNYAVLCLNYFEEIQEDLVEIEQAFELDEEFEDLKEVIEIVGKNLQQIWGQGQRADNIIQMMLLHAHHETTAPEPTDINNLVANAIKLVHHSQTENSTVNNISLETNFDNSLEKIEVIPQEIHRALINIINNAYYAVKAKNPTEKDNFKPQIFISTKNLDKQVEICIYDNGTGIDEEILEKIFDPFFTTKPAGEGTGLGLSLTHDIIVGQHQGEIKVTTNSECGTNFTVILPKKSKLEIPELNQSELAE
ncbi:MAG TPA: CHASE2 domain-containing protein [Oculatellaceae cyanobacterium]|jgi:CHASE2 domain-containing sensor protein